MLQERRDKTVMKHQAGVDTFIAGQGSCSHSIYIRLKWIPSSLVRDHVAIPYIRLERIPSSLVRDHVAIPHIQGWSGYLHRWSGIM